MTRASHGDDVKDRVKRLFAVLISLSDLNEDNCDINFKWHESEAHRQKLVVKTTLKHLETLTKKDGSGYLTKNQIREALHRMQDFLEILEDHRLHQRGTENWDFTLKPWFNNRAENLKQFEIEWNNRRSPKSKQRAASSAAAVKTKNTEYKKNFFCQAPPLPQYFIERPKHQKAVKNLLLAKSADAPGILVVSAIYGLGGIGKSTLAAALAHDKDVQTHFPDGILWVTLGQNPDLLPLLGNWIKSLGDGNYKPVNVDVTSMHLQTVLYNKKALLVVDDAWNPEHVEPFRVGGSDCQVLVTTREAVIKGATPYNLDALTPDESVELLQKSCGSLKPEEQQLAQELAATVGYLPLALDLAASQIAEGVTWLELLEDLQTDIAYLETLDLPGLEKYSSEEKRKHYSLIGSFNLSLRSLTPEMLQQFAWFGVLPEDVNITAAMAATLWSITPRQALTTLRSFKTKALLLSGINLDEQQTYRLHDLMHDMAKRSLTSKPSPHQPHELPGLGLKLADAHSQLLKRYQKKTKSGLWHTLEDDGYIYVNLSWHLEQAQRVEDLHQLLQEETETGHNGWYETCDHLGKTANFVSDVARAWRLVGETFEKNPSSSIGLQCRYALIIASLNSLVNSVPVELVLASVQKNVWEPIQALAYIEQSSNPKQKVNSLTKLANHLPQNLKELAFSKALATAKLIKSGNHPGSDHFMALAALADKLPPRLLPDALTAAREIQDEYYRFMALAALVDKLPQKLLRDARAAAKEIQGEYSRARALAALADKLPDLLPEARAAAREIQDECGRASALIALSDKLPELLPEARAAAREIQDECGRAEALIALSDKLPELLPEALATAKQIQADWNRSTALYALAYNLPPELLPEALAATREIQDQWNRARVLTALAYNLPPELWSDVLTAVREIQSEQCRANTLRDLANVLPQELLPDVLTALKLIQNEYHRAEALTALADKLPQELLPNVLAAVKEIQFEPARAPALTALANKLPELLPEALAAAKLIQNEYHRAEALTALADKLPPELLREAVAVAREIQDEHSRAPALTALADKLPELLPEALAAAKLIRFENDRARALAALADKLPPELLREALAAAKLIQDEYSRVKALTGLADKLPELLPEARAAAREIQNEHGRAGALTGLSDKLPELLPEALAAAKLIQDEYYRAIILAALADKLPPELLREALAAAKLIQDEYSRAPALTGLADKLPELLREALAAAKLIQNEHSRAPALTGLADKLPPELLREALAVAREIQGEHSRAPALTGLADKLPPELLREALAVAREIQGEHRRAEALTGLADKLPPELLREAVAAARQMQSEYNRARALTALADKLPELLPEALAVAKLIHDEYSRGGVLTALAHKLPPELLREALAAAKLLLHEQMRAYVLKALADKLPLELLLDALAAAREIQGEEYRATALTALAHKLPPEFLLDVLVDAREIQFQEARAWVLFALADRLPQEELLPEALAAAKLIDGQGNRAKVLKDLAIPLSRMPTDQLFSCWEQTLKELALRTRQDLLIDIEELVPVIYALGGDAAIASVGLAIQKVGRWWH